MHWTALHPALAIWLKVGASRENPGWISLAGVDWVELVIDGNQL